MTDYRIVLINKKLIDEVCEEYSRLTVDVQSSGLTLSDSCLCRPLQTPRASSNPNQSLSLSFE